MNVTKFQNIFHCEGNSFLSHCPILFAGCHVLFEQLCLKKAISYSVKSHTGKGYVISCAQVLFVISVRLSQQHIINLYPANVDFWVSS